MVVLTVLFSQTAGALIVAIYMIVRALAVRGATFVWPPMVIYVLSLYEPLAFAFLLDRVRLRAPFAFRRALELSSFAFQMLIHSALLDSVWLLGDPFPAQPTIIGLFLMLLLDAVLYFAIAGFVELLTNSTRAFKYTAH